MASWDELRAAAPDLAAAVRARFGANRHAILATLDRSGAPRLSGIEVVFWDGEVWLGMMPRSIKAADLRRDPRFAVHCAPLDIDLGDGDAKLRGRAEPITDPARKEAFAASLPHSPPAGEMALFRGDLTEVVLTRVTPERDHLMIDSWRPGTAVVQRLV
jgi:hypothetical protein